MEIPTLCVGDGNQKIGAHVPTFSLPSKMTCPGKSVWCVNHCYADRYERMRPSIRSAYERNLAIARYPALLVNFMLGALSNTQTWFRIHPAGDFFSEAYIDSWSEIIQAKPGIQFWAYTRSWRLSTLLPGLEGLRALPNVQIFASTDPDMPLPPPGWRTALLNLP